MNKIEVLIVFLSLLIIVFLIDYFIINKPKLQLITNKGVTKKGKKKKIKNISELDYLITKFKLKEKKLNKNKIIIWVSFLNSFIIAFTSSIVMALDLNMLLQFLIAFVLLFSLIYALYEIYGRHLKKEQERKSE